MTLYDFLYWISTLQLYGNRLNILGLIWLVSMVLYTYSQINKPLNELRSRKGRIHIGWKTMIVLSVIPVILLHFITDEIVTALVIIFGGWNYYGGGGKPFSFGLLWSMKFDVYLSMICFSLMFIILDLEKFFKVRKNTVIIFGCLMAVYFYAAITHVGDFVIFQDWDRFWRFWIFYPLTYILLTMLYFSMLNKSHRISLSRPGAGVIARMIDVGRHSMMHQLTQPNRFGLNAGSGSTWFYNKINLDVRRSRNTDVQADLRAIPFRDESFSEIIIDEVLEHISQDGKVLDELHRVLAPEGALYISVPITGILAKIDKILLHSREYHASYSQKQLCQLLTHSGFHVKQIFIYGTLPHYLHIRTLGGCLFMIASRPGD